MGDKTSIEWTRGDDGSPGATWNPLRGAKGKWSCVKISEGCAHCYAERFNVRQGGPEYKVGVDELRLDETILGQPLRWKRPRKIFVCSMTDLFEERVPDEWIDRIFAVMAQAPQHIFQVLTKRAERMQSYLSDSSLPDAPWRWTRYMTGIGGKDLERWTDEVRSRRLLNLWCGVSVENQARADERIPWLLKTPAAVRFLSVEPLLGAVDLKRYLYPQSIRGLYAEPPKSLPEHNWVNWVIVGGESGGPPERALVERVKIGTGQFLGPTHEWCLKPKALEWLRAIRDQCQAAGVAFFHKQNGGPTPKSGGRLLDGRTWDELPAG